MFRVLYIGVLLLVLVVLNLPTILCYGLGRIMDHFTFNHR